MAAKFMNRARSAVIAVLFTVFASAPALSQGYAQTIDLGGGCGSTSPTLNSTPPLLTTNLTFFVTGCAPNAPITLFIAPPLPGPVALGNGCVAWVDTIHFAFVGVTTSVGSYSITFPTTDLVGFTPGAVCDAQAVIESTDPCAVPIGSATGLLTNGLRLIMGTQHCGPRNGLEWDAFCTYTPCNYAYPCGIAGQLINNHFISTFPNGFEIGDYSTAGGNAAPNGKRFTANSTGKSALKSYLDGWFGSSGVFTSDNTNSTGASGAGILGQEIGAVNLNIGFSDAGRTIQGFGDLVFVKPSSSLNGYTVRQIDQVLNDAVAGLGLPAGYSLSGLRTLADNLNEAFKYCDMSCWAAYYLFPKHAP